VNQNSQNYFGEQFIAQPGSTIKVQSFFDRQNQDIVMNPEQSNMFDHIARSNEKSPNVMKEDMPRKNNKLYNLVFE
tara:strand:+ start:3171 stop:3398 length:228 start_codon:yes stop_codon:yes gene_type:complete